MVCTTAFGMGVDVPNIEVIVRVGCPPSLEELIQEFGRAGRDGRIAKGMYMMCLPIIYVVILSLHPYNQFNLLIGVLLYCESDVQHALYWCKDRTKEHQDFVLTEYQYVWK